jgi:hypothetical protein
MLSLHNVIDSIYHDPMRASTLPPYPSRACTILNKLLLLLLLPPSLPLFPHAQPPFLTHTTSIRTHNKKLMDLSHPTSPAAPAAPPSHPAKFSFMCVCAALTQLLLVLLIASNAAPSIPSASTSPAHSPAARPASSMSPPPHLRLLVISLSTASRCRVLCRRVLLRLSSALFRQVRQQRQQPAQPIHTQKRGPGTGEGPGTDVKEGGEGERERKKKGERVRAHAPASVCVCAGEGYRQTHALANSHVHDEAG